jgi:hypothetical protein
MEIITTSNGTEYVLFEHAPNEFTSMPKSEYDRQQAEQSTPSLPE